MSKAEDDKNLLKPQGIIAIMTNATGEVIATATDFERQGYGGFKLWEAQKQRAGQQVKWATVRAYCSIVVVNAITSYVSTQIADELCQKGRGGHKITYRAIGYSEEITAEVERR